MGRFGRLVVISGVTSGIGRALFCEFAKRGEGFRVAGCGRRYDRLQALRAEVASKKDGDGHLLAQVDVTSDAAVADWAASVVAAHGGPPSIVIARESDVSASLPSRVLKRAVTDTNLSIDRQLADTPDGTQRVATRAFNHVLRQHSSASVLVMTNLPLPKETDETSAYMQHLEELTTGIPRVLLVAGQRDGEVITMYS